MSTSLTELTQQAQVLKAEGRHVEAIDVLKSLVEIEPENVAVLHNYAAGLGEAGRHREAITILRRAFNLELNAPESWLVYARCLSGVGEFQEAEKAFFKLFGLRPTDHDAHREYAQLVWMQTGDRNKALAVLNKAIEAHPAISALHIARAQVFGQTGEPETEHAIMKEAARLTPSDPYLQYAACNSALADEKFDEAVEYGRRAVEALPNENGAVVGYCMALLAVGDAADAAKVAEELRRRNPVNQLAISLQATAWRILGDDRYHELYDYDEFVFASPLDTPKGWGSLDSYLEELIDGLDRAHIYKTHPFDQSVRHGSQISSIDGADNAAMRAYAEAASGPFQRYLDALKPGDDPLRSRHIGGFRLFSTWSISLPPKGFHVNHVHPQGWLSSACHLRPAEKDPASEKAGWLKFGEPGVATTPKLEAEQFAEPEPGVMVVFPSYMWHGTVDFESGRPRLTVAVDVVPAALAE